MQAPIDDKDVVFARFKSNKPASASRGEMLTIPRRAGASRSRIVQVVHLRTGAAFQDRPRRIGVRPRAAACDGVFAAR